MSKETLSLGSLISVTLSNTSKASASPMRLPLLTKDNNITNKSTCTSNTADN